VTETVSSYEENSVEWVTVPVPGEGLQAAAKALLAAAGDKPEVVRTVSGGFRAPHAVVKAAGLLDDVAAEEPDAPAEAPAAGKKPAAKKPAADAEA
jgi:hypothetical protein